MTGGIGTVLVVLTVAWLWPQIRKYGKLREILRLMRNVFGVKFRSNE